VSYPADVAAVQRAVLEAREAPAGRGLLTRGLGRSYGDAAMNAGGQVLRLSAFDTIGIPARDGTIEIGAGASLHDVLARIVPQGWFVPVTPGTRLVTMGGAVSSDVHGKNHHRDGSLGSHLTFVDIVDGTGQARRLTPDDALFSAVVGGMGLAAVITRVGLRLRPIQTSSMTVHTTRTRDLEETMAQLVADDEGYRYTVAWLDTLAPGASLGRGVVTSGEHAPQGMPGSRPLADYRARALAPATPWAPQGLLTPRLVRAFNEAYYRRAPAQPTTDVQSIPAFFHPLDVLTGWNRLYGRRGFLQYQFVVPDPAAVERFVVTLQRHRVPGLLAVLKRFGPAAPAPLSFPRPGWTLAVDMPAHPSLGALLDRLDEDVVSAGGRQYFAKDGRMRPELVRVMYPRLDEWRTLRAQSDPDHVFTSDLARRLDLC
jgi:decaprenylphospho-beta-D-ribofuranose 2-oxidase